MLQIILNKQKKGYIFARDPRGCDVAEPRRPTRVLAWRGGDTWHAYLYLLVILGL